MRDTVQRGVKSKRVEKKEAASRELMRMREGEVLMSCERCIAGPAAQAWNRPSNRDNQGQPQLQRA